MSLPLMASGKSPLHGEDRPHMGFIGLVKPMRDEFNGSGKSNLREAGKMPQVGDVHMG